MNASYMENVTFIERKLQLARADTNIIRHLLLEIQNM